MICKQRVKAGQVISIPEGACQGKYKPCVLKIGFQNWEHPGTYWRDKEAVNSIVLGPCESCGEPFA